MNPPPLDDQTADRLLGGSVAPEDAPPGFAAVAALVRAARGPATDEELAAVPFTPSARPVAAGPGAPSTARPVVVPLTPPPRRRRGALAVRVGLVAAVVGLGTTAAAASQGKLPDPVQRLVSQVAGHVGWDIPDPDEPASTTTATGHGPGPSGTPASSATGAITAAEQSLCARFGDGLARPLDRPPFDALVVAAFPGGVPAGLDKPALVAGVVAFCQGLDTATSVAGGPPASTPGNGPPASNPGSGPPASNPGSGPPASKPGNPTPGTNPGSGPPASKPGNPTPGTSVAHGPSASKPGNPTPGTSPTSPPGSGGGKGSGGATTTAGAPTESDAPPASTGAGSAVKGKGGGAPATPHTPSPGG